jgi:hypothetical protein
VTPLVGADVDRSSIRDLTGGEDDMALANGRDRAATALAKFAVELLLNVACVCSGEVEYGVCVVVCAPLSVGVLDKMGGVFPVEYGVTGSEAIVSLPHGPFELP